MDPKISYLNFVPQFWILFADRQKLGLEGLNAWQLSRLQNFILPPQPLQLNLHLDKEWKYIAAHFRAF